MSSEWMKVMLEEIARKKAQRDEAHAEDEEHSEAGRRASDQSAAMNDSPAGGPDRGA